MKYFDFNLYKGNSQYIILFDEFIKEQGDLKKDIFKKLFISNSSYNRLRTVELKNGNIIIDSLIENYQLSGVSNELINYLEYLFEKIYYKMNYKIFDSYEEDMKIIDKMLSDKSILFPILYLIKLYMNVNRNRLITEVKYEDMELYKKIKPYAKFFTEELLDVFECLKLIFEKNMINDMYLKPYNNPICYQILALKMLGQEQYNQSLYYAMRAKDIFINENNYKRLILNTKIIIESLLNLYNYEDCYKIIFNYKFSLMAMNANENELEICNRYICLILLGLKKYDYIIRIFKNNKELNTLETISYIIAINKLYDKYEKKNDILYNKLNKNLINIINEYMKDKKDDLLKQIDKTILSKSLIKILRNL